jgi:undecaprenyl-diphosphatase
VGEVLQKIIEMTLFRGAAKAEIELLFSHLELIAPALAAAGILILIAGLDEKRRRTSTAEKTKSGEGTLGLKQAGWMGLVQGLALPFRGFSRSGSTISAGMLTGAAREPAERFSFALAVVLTPPVVLREALRLVKSAHEAAAAGAPVDLHGAVLMSLLGAVLACAAGLAALKWLSSWLESGRWHWFGVYCLAASGVVFYLHLRGF